jgi:hypothetical protein
MTLFFLGFITGAVHSLLFFLASLWFQAKYPEKSRNLYKKAIPTQKAEIFIPPTGRELKNQDIMERNNREGRPTKLTDLL